ncbi:MAG: acyl-CoA dehydrogenase family protein [Candidatus Neomarinimicrobiota bacterium]
MEKPQNPQTGGSFLIESIDTAKIFTRENFSEEHLEIEAMVKEFSLEKVRPQKAAIEAFDQDLSLKLIREMGELGLLGIDVPEEYGGMDLDKITTAIVAESLAHSGCASFVVTWSVQTGIGALPIVWFGTREQKKKYLPKLVTGEHIGAYGLTEATAGSDALSGKTTAILSEDGKHYILNGEKIFITNGGWAQVYCVFAQVDGNKFSCFIVDRDTPGFSVGVEEKKMGMKGSSTTSLIFNEAKVPVENLLFKVGQGATIAFNALNMGRIKLAVSDLGGSKAVIKVAVNYALERRQFGQPIAFFDTIIGKFSDMAVRTFASDSMIYRTLGLIQEAINKLDKSDPHYYIKLGEALESYAVEASMVKVFGSESSGEIIDSALQVLGGNGFIEEYPMASVYRDTRIDRIWEGTNEINRQIVTGYMMKKALMEEIPVRDAIRGIDSFMEQGLSQFKAEILPQECRTIEIGKRMALYIFNEALCKFGQDLKHEQQLTDILADIFTDIYTAESTVLRAIQILKNDKQAEAVTAVAKIYTAEMVLRLLNKSLTAVNGIYGGKTTADVIEKLRKFQGNMVLSTDIIGLKRKLAEYLYSKKDYPF